MCGIAGAVNGKSLKISRSDLDKMLVRIAHRGPDSKGQWEEDGVIFGHLRLAIIDLTQAGHQPMLSHDGRYVLTYNGEIYNHLAIRSELEQQFNIVWRGHSDTETLVEAIARWGIARTLDQLNGMFAFAVWDRKQKSIILARDPFGEKPLLYTVRGDALAFASELSALLAVPTLKSSPDPQAIARYLHDWYVPSPLSIMSGINKLPPASYLQWKAGSEPEIKTYWSVAQLVEPGRANLLNNDKAAIDELEQVMTESVKLRMLSDVPLGAMLSGGIDSSLVTALMQKLSSTPVQTFTIGFDDKDVDESQHAAAVSNHLGTKHTLLNLSEADALAIAPNMGSLYDEPFADASQIPTYLVSKLARQHVTVALTGDGCDELFSGYARHTMTRNMWNTIRKIPARNMLSKHVANVPGPILDLAAMLMKPMVPKGVNGESLRRKLAHSGNLLNCNSAQEIYQSYMTSWPNPDALMAHPLELREPKMPHRPIFQSLEDEFVWQDSVDYLPNDILTKVDRASMAVSLETRIPALDKKVAEFAWRLPQDMRWRDGKGKWALRELLYRYVPQSMVDRPKRGFSVPLDKWLRGSLRDWANDLLSPTLIKRQGILNANEVQTQLANFEKGRGVSAHQMWTLLMLQSWLAANGY